MKHVTWIACLVLMTLGVCPGAATLRGVSGELHLRITSPLGRTGTVGVVRIVAQIDRVTDATVGRCGSLSTASCCERSTRVHPTRPMAGR